MTQNKGRSAIVAVALMTSFMATFTGSALNLSVPSIGAEFSVGAVSVSWVINGYILATAAFAVPFGRLADLTDRRRILSLGIFFFSIMAGATTIAQSFEWLVALRVAQGVASAMIIGTGQALLIGAFPPEKRGRILGYLIAATYTGLTAGPVLGGLLNQWFGWRSILLATLIIGLAATWISARGIPAEPKHSGRRPITWASLDLPGGVLYVAAIVLLVFGFSAIARVPAAKYLLASAPVLLYAFVRYEQRAQSPIVQIRLFRRNRNYLFSNLAALLNYGATFAVGYLLSVYLQVVRGFESGSAGLVLISQPLLMALLSPLAGRLSDRISPFRLASIGMALCAIGLFLFGRLDQNWSLAALVGVLMLIGVGFALFSSPNTNAVMSLVEPGDYSVASSVLATMRTVGQSASLAAVSLAFALTVGDTPLHVVEPERLIRVMQSVFLVFAVVCLCGIGFSLRRKA